MHANWATIKCSVIVCGVILGCYTPFIRPEGRRVEFSTPVFLNRGYAKRKHELLGAPMSLSHDSSVNTKLIRIPLIPHPVSKSKQALHRSNGYYVCRLCIEKQAPS